MGIFDTRRYNMRVVYKIQLYLSGDVYFSKRI